MPQTVSRDPISQTDVAPSDRPPDAHRTSPNGVRASRGRIPTETGDGRGAFAMFGTLTGIATLTAVLVVGGAGLGLLLDSWTSAPHVFVFLGLVLGVLTAVLAVRSIVRRFFR